MFECRSPGGGGAARRGTLDPTEVVRPLSAFDSVIIALAVVLFLPLGILAVVLPRTKPRRQKTTACAPPVPRTHVSARVMFVGSRARHLFVDCTVDDSSHNTVALPQGLPISLEVRSPESPWLATFVAEMLQSWAVNGDVVDVEIGSTPAGRRAELAHGDNRLVFELEQLTGVR